MIGVVHYLLACTNDAAHRTAVHVWGWQPTKIDRGQRAFINLHGETVISTSSADRLEGIRTESKLYLGESYLFAHGDVRAAIGSHRDRGGLVIEEGSL